MTTAANDVPVFNQTNIDGALMLACNGDFGQQLFEVLESAGKLPPSLYSYKRQLDEDLQFWRKKKYYESQES